MPLDLKKEIWNKQMILIIIPNEKYTESILEIVKQLSKIYKKTCYVSLNKLYSALLKSLEDDGIDTEKFCFVDVITKTADPQFKGGKNCRCIPSPSHLTEISLGISEDLKVNKPNCLLFDSLSTILIYQKGDVVTRFVHSLTGNIRKSGCVGVLTVLEGDTANTSIKEMSMFVDKVIHIKE